jgi:hypothetical protein
MPDPVIYDDEGDLPVVDVCRDCNTPTTCSLYERCMRTNDFLCEDEESEL